MKVFIMTEPDDARSLVSRIFTMLRNLNSEIKVYLASSTDWYSTVKQKVEEEHGLKLN